MRGRARPLCAFIAIAAGALAFEAGCYDSDRSGPVHNPSRLREGQVQTTADTPSTAATAVSGSGRDGSYRAVHK